ncbi:MAG: hypothetical protein HQL80_05155 [Magnetococcales bacterium]|nr:hypothetical protein [Magnetococcales bacterium]
MTGGNQRVLVATNDHLAGGCRVEWWPCWGRVLGTEFSLVGTMWVLEQKRPPGEWP